MVIAVDKGFDAVIWSACHEAKLPVFLLNKLIVISCERKDFKSSKKRLLLVKVENENKEANKAYGHTRDGIHPLSSTASSYFTA